ncbi:hypothetical protein XaFJ1_GM002210 [Xanthomonas albilineans]|nr:hypothetical protein XaFJ1_GM002210 [Xanthomonas albilineans]
MAMPGSITAFFNPSVTWPHPLGSLASDAGMCEYIPAKRCAARPAGMRSGARYTEASILSG